MTTGNGGSAKTCKGCAGRGLVSANGGRNTQACPLCGGTGQNQQVFRVPFDYVWPAIALTANQVNLTATLQVDFDSDFEWIWIVSDQTGSWSVTTYDNSTGRQLQNNPINNDNFAGTAQLPFPLVEPYLLARSSSMRGVFNDLSGNTNNVQLVFKGYKLYPSGAPQQGSAGMVVNQQGQGV
jgi:hypothetical protein